MLVGIITDLSSIFYTRFWIVGTPKGHVTTFNVLLHVLIGQ